MKAKSCSAVQTNVFFEAFTEVEVPVKKQQELTVKREHICNLFVTYRASVRNRLALSPIVFYAILMCYDASRIIAFYCGCL